MSDGFSINLRDQDLKDISEKYYRLKLDHEKSKVDKSSSDYLCTYFLFLGFKEALEYVGIDPKIFENGIEPLE